MDRARSTNQRKESLWAADLFHQELANLEAQRVDYLKQPSSGERLYELLREQLLDICTRCLGPVTIITAEQVVDLVLQLLYDDEDIIRRQRPSDVRVPKTSIPNALYLCSRDIANKTVLHYEYDEAGARILLLAIYSVTCNRFSECLEVNGMLPTIRRRIDGEPLALYDKFINHRYDLAFTYEGLMTLLKTSLAHSSAIRATQNHSELPHVYERPQYMYMRQAIAVHPASLCPTLSLYEDLAGDRYFTFATPTMANAGREVATGNIASPSPSDVAAPPETSGPRVHKASNLSSCYVIDPKDCIRHKEDVLVKIGQVSKNLGGIGVNLSGTYWPFGEFASFTKFMKEAETRIVDYSSPHRPASAAVYLEPWQAFIMSFADIRHPQTPAEARCEKLFPALWMPDLFFEYVLAGRDWCMIPGDPHITMALNRSYGDDFRRLYEGYCAQTKIVISMRAETLFRHFLKSMIESGTPYLMFKDACNEKSNHKHLGPILCSNLCTEILQYTNHCDQRYTPNGVDAICNLASLSLPAFLKSVPLDNNGSMHEVWVRHKLDVEPPSGSDWSLWMESAVDVLHQHFNFPQLIELSGRLVRHMNSVVDSNVPALDSTEYANGVLRSLGIGIQGLADVLMVLEIPYASRLSTFFQGLIAECVYYGALETSASMAAEDPQLMEKLVAVRGLTVMEKFGTFQHDMWRADLKKRCKEMLDGPRRGPNELQAREYAHWLLATTLKENNYHHSLFHMDWETLRSRVMSTYCLNTQVTAYMPTVSTSQVLGNFESFDACHSNLFMRNALHGTRVVLNRHLMRKTEQLGIWSAQLQQQLYDNDGDVTDILLLPDYVRDVYKTVWNMTQADRREMLLAAATRGCFIDQSQSMSLYIPEARTSHLAELILLGWRLGLKTGCYYTRTDTATRAQKVSYGTCASCSA